MPRRSLYTSLITRNTLPLLSRTANATVNGTGVDRTDPVGGVDSFTSALFLIVTGVVTDGTWTCAVQESDDNSSFSVVAAEEIQGTVPVIAAANDNTHYEIGYMGNKRYLRVSVVSTGSTTGAIIGGYVILGDPGSKPVQR